MESYITVLRWFQGAGAEELTPIPDPTAAVGYRYGELENAALHGETLHALLSELVERGCLGRRAVDTVHTCAKCGRWELNFREVCPSCRSVDHQLHEVLHHFPCAYSGPRARFARDGHLSCPKCERELLQIGIDYDRPGQVRVCACGESFAEPLVECKCLACRALFPVEQAEKVVLHAYRLTQKGRLAAESGQLEPQDFDQLVRERGIFTFGYLSHRLQDEVARAKRFGRPLSVVLVRAAADSRGATGPSATNLAQVLAARVRPGELLGSFDATTLLYLLPETAADEARGVVLKLGAEIAATLRLTEAPFHYGLASFPEQPDREALLAAAEQDLAERQAPARLACGA